MLMYRHEGELSVDAVIDWFAMAVLNLPRIFYYSKESLVMCIVSLSEVSLIIKVQFGIKLGILDALPYFRAFDSFHCKTLTSQRNQITFVPYGRPQFFFG